ncbi:MAG TPA: hypothetical protein VNO31_25925 [Umezawaea sp.]|nr:hypothetical protein [Umezawaea sp.]
MAVTIDTGTANVWVDSAADSRTSEAPAILASLVPTAAPALSVEDGDNVGAAVELPLANALSSRTAAPTPGRNLFLMIFNALS